MLDFRRRSVDKRRPMAIQVKICGITGTDAADAALKSGVDFAGLVFHPNSPRNLSHARAQAIAARLKGRARVVALLVDARDEEIATIVDATDADFLQLHGNESPARTTFIRNRFGRGIIKVFQVAEASDLAVVPAYDDAADYFLFDAKSPQDATRPGGHGAAFDWQLLRRQTFSRPWLLAGGLDPENVARAIATSGASAVDVSSGVETAPGQKSPDLIRAFVDAVRKAEFAAGAAA